ncbi:MAG: signal peptide peptidase SppA [Rickettsiaceae bacterium]|nr:signal peptide peptidase SppA [Rickettsiaceae bacterium]
MQIPDLLVERTKYIRRNFLLKLGLLGVILIFFVVYLAKNKGGSVASIQKEYIGIIRIDNIIADDIAFDKMLDEIPENKLIKALVVEVNSPGGSSGASEKIYHKLKKIQQKIPIVTSMGSLAASGGYLVSLASNRIFAMNMTITGSIGVIFQTAQIVELAEKLGVKFKNYKSSEFKASPNAREIASPEVEKVIMDLIYDSHNYFLSLVAENRKLDKDFARKIGDGRIFTGRQALENKLIDEIGTVDDAIAWLKKTYKLEKLSTKPVEPKKISSLLSIILEKLEENTKMITGAFDSGLFTIYR